MTAYTSEQTGNWTRASNFADSPWYDGAGNPQALLASYPGDGDSATVSHDITVDDDLTVGDGSDSITIDSDATVTVDTDKTLTIKGTMVVGDLSEKDNHGGLTLSPGSTFTDDDNNRDVNLGASILSSTATSGSWATVGGTLSIQGVLTEGSDNVVKRFDFEYTKFTTSGDLDFNAGSFGLLTSYIHFVYCTFSGVNSVEFGAGNQTSDTAVQETNYCDFRSCGNIYINGKDSATRTIDFKFNTIGSCTQVRSFVSNIDFTGTVVANCTANPMLQIDDVCTVADLFLARDSGDADALLRHNVTGGTIEDSFFWHGGTATNSHTVDGLSVVIQDNVFEIRTTEPNIFQVESSATVTIQRNLLLGGGVLANNVGAHTGSTVNVLHNTLYLDEIDYAHQGLWLSENGDLTSSTLNIKSNLAGFASSGNTYTDLFHDNTSGDNQVIDESSYNAFWNAAADPYDADITVTTKNDFGDCTDPQFKDDTRTLETWGSTEHSTDGSASAAIALFLARNGYNSSTKTQSDTPSGVTVADLITWVTAGFKVQNMTLASAGHDGETIGAFAFDSVPAKWSLVGNNYVRS
jgi:hypothetical protein